VTLECSFFGGGGITPPSVRGRNGTITQPPLGVEQCPAAERNYSDRLWGTAAFLHSKASDQINHNVPTEKSKTNGAGSDQITRTEGTGSPRHTGVDKVAGHWRLGPTVYEVCSFLLKNSSIT
jgi:hypothetical protein